jgi:hypothetical protein
MEWRSIALALLLVAAPALRGQGKSPRVDLSLPDAIVAGTSVPTASISGVLTEGHRQELLNAGWQTAIHLRLELWRKGRFGIFDRESVIEWDMIVEYSPAAKTYHVRRIVDNKVDDLGGDVSSIDAAEQLLRRPYTPALSPERSGGRYFYLLNAEVSTLSLSDLEAWQRWIKGEAQPAVRGKKSPVGAFQRGLGSLLSRVLGGDTQTYETRSAVFSAG